MLQEFVPVKLVKVPCTDLEAVPPSTGSSGTGTGTGTGSRDSQTGSIGTGAQEIPVLAQK